MVCTAAQNKMVPWCNLMDPRISQISMALCRCTEMFYLCIQCPLQLQHIGILLRIDVVVRKIHQQTFNVEPGIKSNLLTVITECPKLYLQYSFISIKDIPHNPDSCPHTDDDYVLD